MTDDMGAACECDHARRAHKEYWSICAVHGCPCLTFRARPPAPVSLSPTPKVGDLVDVKFRGVYSNNADGDQIWVRLADNSTHRVPRKFARLTPPDPKFGEVWADKNGREAFVCQRPEACDITALFVRYADGGFDAIADFDPVRRVFPPAGELVRPGEATP